MIKEIPCKKIITESKLPEADYVVNPFYNVDVGLSFSSHDDSVRRVFESHTSAVEAKLQALITLHKEGIKTYAFLGPILPGITNLEEIIPTLVDTGIASIMIENLNLKGVGVFLSVIEAINKHYPDLVSLYQQVKQDPKSYWSPIKEQIIAISERYDIPFKLYFDH